jgi:hypothetical protein
MPHISIPPQLVSLLGSTQVQLNQATDALEEWILHRRLKGDTLFEVSVGLAELEDRVSFHVHNFCLCQTPPHLGRAFDRARYVTNVPQPTDLTPPMGPFPLARSASPTTILHHLLSSPPPTIERSREIILEYVLGRELKIREKKPGPGGRGTIGRDGFEEISKRLAEIEDELRASASPDLDEARQIGLTLILSLRMTLSYFTLQELADQLDQLNIADAERILVQHIRRRVQGEGRYGVGSELEYVESLVGINRNSADFRSHPNAPLSVRHSEPQKPVHPFPLGRTIGSRCPPRPSHPALSCF